MNECNLGYNQNFEKAISFCSGEFIAVSDQDDIWLPDKITSLLNNIGDYLLIYGNSEFINSEGKPLGVQIIGPDRNSSNFLNYKSILLQNFVTGHNILFKKEALQYILPFPQNSFYDWWIGFVLLYEEKITYLNKICTFYRTHDFSVMSQLNSSKQNRMDRHYSETTLIFNQLRDFKNYKNLKKTDLDFFTKFESAFNEKINSYFAIQLFDILLKNFNSLFPDNHKTLIKRLAFLMRYCRGLKLIKATSKNHK
jgi:glycosyltransferase involved in cell wall biosynthesis